MKKYLISLSILLVSLDIDAKQILCPSTIVCNYLKGTCEHTDGWRLEDNGIWDVTDDSKTLKLFSIYWYQAKNGDGVPIIIYHSKISCGYREEASTQGGISLQKNVSKINGNNWIFKGFGKSYAQCSDISDPSQCTGEE